jgi:two-component system response regulator AtoC
VSKPPPHEFADASTERIDPDDLARGRWLVVLAAGGTRVVPLVPGSTLRVGRAAECDVVVIDTAVSRHHAQLHVDGKRIEIEDLDSANGVQVSGVRVEPRTRVALSPGTVVQIGNATLLLQAGSRPPSIEASAARSETLEPAQPGRDPAMARLYETASRVARTPIAVLVTGETGVGKELLATAIHERSPRKQAPFVTLNCAALAPQLLESELFGHERGAFTGADRSKPGLLESAHGGTVFLDEVGEMALDLQAKLLRVLEDRKVRRVGATTDRAIDVRFVSATNRDLEAAVAAGTFRRDLYYRLKGVVLTIPPLRTRTSEIRMLAEGFLAAAAPDRLLELSASTLELLLAHTWPGNVRELRQAMEHAAALSDGPRIEPSDLPSDIARSHAIAPPISTPAAAVLRDDLAAIEKRRIVDALAACDGNQTRAAEMLGMPRRTLVTRIEQYGLPRPRKDR